MTDPNNFSEEEELRRSIRAEIEQREIKKQRDMKRKEARRSASEQAELKRRIYKEELRKYYQNRPGYKEVIGDDGEPDWILESEAQAAESLFEEVVEDPIQAKKKQKVVISLISLVVIVAIIVIYTILHAGVGSIMVTCNVKGANIFLDAVPTRYLTDATLVEVPAGEHYLTVEKEGYQIVGDPVRQVVIKDGDDLHVTFILEPAPKAVEGDNTGNGGRP